MEEVITITKRVTTIIEGVTTSQILYLIKANI